MSQLSWNCGFTNTWRDQAARELQWIQNHHIKTWNLVLPPDVFIVPNGHCSGLQQPVHEPARPTRPPWRYESSQHGIRHEQPQYEWASHGHEPGSNPRHGAFWGSWPKNASARVSWRTPTRHSYTGDEEAISRRGEWKDLMIAANWRLWFSCRHEASLREKC